MSEKLSRSGRPSEGNQRAVVIGGAADPVSVQCCRDKSGDIFRGLAGRAAAHPAASFIDRAGDLFSVVNEARQDHLSPRRAFKLFFEKEPLRVPVLGV
jgi:hypothetical protein